MSAFAVTPEQRWAVFRALAPYFGRVVPAKFIQKTLSSLPGVDRIHNLAQGIYKPAESIYALTIVSMLDNPYADRLEFNPDRSWYFYYSPKAEALNSAVNHSVFTCMRDAEPLLLIKQVTDNRSPQGSQYKILGLGLIESFDDDEQLFKIQEVTIEAFQQRVDPTQVLSDDLIETALQLEALEAWTPYVAEDRAVYRVSRIKRDAAFRKVVLENYGRTCAITGSKFQYGDVVEAQAAHIISKEVNGTDDPRNGLALGRTAHWAFDQGLFSITDQFEVCVHPKAREASSKNFQLLELDRKRIVLPADESTYPHAEALRWHEKEVFGKFCR